MSETEKISASAPGRRRQSLEHLNVQEGVLHIVDASRVPLFVAAFFLADCLLAAAYLGDHLIGHWEATS